nr:RagB/SusD family nutrient uptake outer membrane protein [uncultured Prevotella sp.]
MNMLTKYIGASVVLALLTSCNDFLDVQPKGQNTEDQMFTTITGYEDAMFGVYGKLASSNLYGESLSWGLVDKLGQEFGYDNSQDVSYYLNRYQYTNQQARLQTDAIWKNMYSNIANVNNVLRHMNDISSAPQERRLIHGEALGLRAFMHFDLARLYCTDYTRSDANTLGLPYATEFNLKNRSRYSLHDTFKLIIGDLNAADSLLSDDNNVTYNNVLQRDYHQDRVIFFNKYAVKATKARVYYAMGNKSEAAKYAREVINATQNFKLNTTTSIDSIMRFPANKEMIFGVYAADRSGAIRSAFLRATGAGTFTEGRRDARSLYETDHFTATSSDARYSSFFRENTSSGASTFSFIRFIQNDAEANNNTLKGFVLISLPEMYYILSESVYDTNKTEAISLLNAVRKSRGLGDVDVSKVSTRELFEQEMMRERMREFPGMGQSFYALKHYNRSFTDFRNVDTYQPSDAIFNLPWPDVENEYGNKEVHKL